VFKIAAKYGEKHLVWQYRIIYYDRWLHGVLCLVEVKNHPDIGENWYPICQKEHTTYLTGGSIVACSKLCAIA
jgi:hypothetical protein